MLIGLNLVYLSGELIVNFNSINTKDKEKTVSIHFDVDSNK